MVPYIETMPLFSFHFLRKGLPLMRRTGDLKLIQELNRSIVLDTIREHGPISRSEIAKKNRISPTTVSSAVSELIQSGLIREDGAGTSSGGRKPILLSFEPNRRFLVGVTITNSIITIAELNLEAKVKRLETFPVRSETGEDFITYILQCMERFLSKCDRLHMCFGISVIAPGIIDSQKGIIRYNSKHRLKNVPFKEICEERFGLDTWLDNDTNALALAEKTFGRFQPYEHLIYIMIGDGVGSGIVVNGSIFRGFSGGAGEFGHISIDRGGIRCECGNRGCLENYVCWPAIYSRILSSIAQGKKTRMLDYAGGVMTDISPDIYRRAVRAGDELACEVTEEIAAYISTGLVSMVNLYNPEVVILGGEIVYDNPLLLSRLQENVGKYALDFVTDGLKIEQTSLGDNFLLVGSAAILLQDIFGFSIA